MFFKYLESDWGQAFGGPKTTPVAPPPPEYLLSLSRYSGGGGATGIVLMPIYGDYLDNEGYSFGDGLSVPRAIIAPSTDKYWVYVPTEDWIQNPFGEGLDLAYQCTHTNFIRCQIPFAWKNFNYSTPDYSNIRDPEETPLSNCTVQLDPVTWGGSRLAYPHHRTGFRPVADQCLLPHAQSMSQSLFSPMHSPNVIRVLSDAQSSRKSAECHVGSA